LVGSKLQITTILSSFLSFAVIFTEPFILFRDALIIGIGQLSFTQLVSTSFYFYYQK